jgi:ribulose-bisphosphate carboxylase small chain
MNDSQGRATAALADTMQPPSGTYVVTRTLRSDAGLRGEVEHALGHGWTCGVEHVDPTRATQAYWQMWRLPMFGATDAQEVLDQLDACRAQHPRDRIRLIGYDRRRQTQALRVVVQVGGHT